MTDVEVLALTLWGEGRGEAVEGRIAIALVIRNRVLADLGHDNKPDWWGEGYSGVCLAPSQFSCWNQLDINRPKLDALARSLDIARRLDPILEECFWIAQGVIAGRVSPRVFDATHYHATWLVPPKWTIGARCVAKCGQHLFYSGVK